MNSSTSDLGTSWWKLLNRYQWFVLVVASLGWLLDCMDQQLFNLARVPAMKTLLAASLGIEAFTGRGPLGAGSVLWLTRGRVVAFVLSGQSLRPSDIVITTRSLWQSGA